MKTLRIILFILLSGCICLSACGEEYEEIEEEQLIVIEIIGKIRFPGSYEFIEPVTIERVIELAGGVLYTADLTRIDTYQLLDKSCTIVIPQINEQVDDDLINLNKASLTELMMLPRIGEAMAKRIIAYRMENGSFKTIEEIMNVPGIKESIFNQINDYITV